MLASLLNKYNIRHKIPGLPQPRDTNAKSPLIIKLEKTRNLQMPNRKDNPSFVTFVFPYVRWDQILRVYMDDPIFCAPKDHEDASTLSISDNDST